MKRAEYCAVLTGDIVGSSRLRQDEMEAIRASIVHAVGKLRKWKRGLLKGRLDFFRGDGWQLVVSDPAMALRVAIFLRASVLAVGLADSRVSIGLGKADKAFSTRVQVKSGEAFVLSGRALDAMTLYVRMTIEAPKRSGALADWLPIIGHLCDSIVRQWTKRQAEIVRVVLTPDDPDYESAGQRLRPRISKQAVAKTLGSANWHVIREAVRRFEETVWELMLKE